MMKPQTIKSRATRTLYKLSCFKKFSIEDSDIIGSIFAIDSKIDIYERGFIFNGKYISKADFTGAALLEKTVESARSIILSFRDGQKTIILESFTGKYKDVFEVYRFFMRVAEDLDIERNSVR
jgi:hypothetical protein